MTSVLIVDDSAIDRRLAGALLAKRGYDVAYAADGREALERCEQVRPDVVVTDLQMPQMTGLELVEALRSRFPSLPVVLMTAHGSEQIAMMALNAGAAIYVAGVADSMQAGIDRARRAVAKGEARRKLDEYVAFTKSVAAKG